MRFLGIDPGLQRTGWGVVVTQGSSLGFVSCGLIAPPPDLELPLRLAYLFNGISAVVAQHHPSHAVVEDTFVNANPRSSLHLGQARGAILTALGIHNVSVLTVEPRALKKGLVGNGRAAKEQVAFMVQRLLPSSPQALTADVSDALGLAIYGTLIGTLDPRLTAAKRKTKTTSSRLRTRIPYKLVRSPSPLANSYPTPHRDTTHNIQNNAQNSPPKNVCQAR